MIVVNGNNEDIIFSYVFSEERFFPVSEFITGSKTIGIFVFDNASCIVSTSSGLPIIPILHARISISSSTSLICSLKKIESCGVMVVIVLVFCAVNDVMTVVA